SVFFFQAEGGIRDKLVTGVQTCALPISAAYRALELARERGIALELTLVEARDRLGGTIGTERTGGFLVEAGPDSFLSEKPWALDLCRRLGVEDRLARTDDRYRKVFVWRAG